MTTGTELNEQIRQTVVAAVSQVPAEVMEPIFADIERMVRAGAAAGSLKVGETAPDFALPDALGRRVRLSDLLAEGPVVLTFYRGEWCPFCNLTLRAYQAVLPEITALGAQFVAISPQTPDHSLSTVQKKELSYPVLSDQGNVVSRQYGVMYTLDEALRPTYTQLGSDLPTHNGEDSWELAMPGTFIVSRDGVVRLAFVDPDYTHRLEPAALLEGLRSLP